MLTGGIFYCRDSAEINDCGSLQTSSWLDSDMLRNRQQKHTAIRCGKIRSAPFATSVRRITSADVARRYANFAHL